jgi:hypothetical protein
MSKVHVHVRGAWSYPWSMSTDKDIFSCIASGYRWACTFKNVAPQKQNAICKTRARYAKRNCAFELFKAHCAATINAKNASLKKNFSAKNASAIFFNKKVKSCEL